MALPRKRRFRSPGGWSKGLDDLHDYIQPYPQGRFSQASRTPKDGSIVVSDDWPEQIPIGDAELRVIEGYLREELDALFGPLP